jgi:hypothetical protein
LKDSNFQKILFINSPKNDFLSDSFLIGLKTLFGEKVFEYPTNQFVYKSNDADVTQMHGIGFTLYGTLDSRDCFAFDESMNLEEFDLVIFGDIYRQSDLYLKWHKQLTRKQTIILDGEDTPAIWPYYRAPWKKPYSFFCPKPHKRFSYFKREIIAKRTNYYRFYKLIPKFLTGFIPLPTIHEISFSIPESKIQTEIIPKTKLFAKHIVDEEVSRQVEGSMTKYAFQHEKDYYDDLNSSKFGITTKRGGWDCLRHYEIAANNAIVCFRNLNEKHDSCAPHGLKDGYNCIDYSNYADLMQKINSLTDEDYRKTQANSIEWAKSYSCQNVVKRTIEKHLELTKNIQH